MANIPINLIIFIAIFMPLNVWTIYVPEHINNDNQFKMDTLEMKPERYNYIKHTINEIQIMQPEAAEQQQSKQQQQESGNKYLLNLNDDNNNDDGHQSSANNNARHSKTAYYTLRHHTSYDTNDDDVANNYNSTINRNNSNYENLEAQPTSLGEEEEHQQHNDDSHLHSRHRRQLSDFLIAPNTRWCGRGNTANGTYNHLGGASMADKCCRTHDHCKVYIPAMSNRYDLFNYRPYTLSHCNCDRRFRTCLKMASDEDANTIGKLFFNLVQTQCFILKKETVCSLRALDGTCDKEHVKQKAYLRNNKKY